MTRLRATLVASTILLGAVLPVACTSSDDDGATTSATLAASAPDGTVGQVAFEHFDGSDGTFAEFAGKPTIVNFFAAWCTPCVRELPAVEQVHQTLGDQVNVVGVSVNERAEDALDLMARTGVTFTVVRDPNLTAVAALGGVGMPTTALLDATGKVVDVRTGTYEADELEAEVREKLLS